MAMLVEFEDSHGKRALVNPEHVISVRERNDVDYPTLITCVDGERIAIKDSIDVTRKKLGM